MEITSDQLRYLREQQGMTREQLAEYLGDSSASTVNKWERGINPVPSWVADKMLAKLPITFSVQELTEMFDLCREQSCSLSDLIQQSVRTLIDQRRASHLAAVMGAKNGAQTPETQENSEEQQQTAGTAASPTTTNNGQPRAEAAKIVPLRTHIMPEPERKVAEDPAPYGPKGKGRQKGA